MPETAVDHLHFVPFLSSDDLWWWWGLHVMSNDGVWRDWHEFDNVEDWVDVCVGGWPQHIGERWNGIGMIDQLDTVKCDLCAEASP